MGQQAHNAQMISLGATCVLRLVVQWEHPVVACSKTLPFGIPLLSAWISHGKRQPLLFFDASLHGTHIFQVELSLALSGCYHAFPSSSMWGALFGFSEPAHSVQVHLQFT